MKSILFAIVFLFSNLCFALFNNKQIITNDTIYTTGLYNISETDLTWIIEDKVYNKLPNTRKEVSDPLVFLEINRFGAFVSEIIEDKSIKYKVQYRYYSKFKDHFELDTEKVYLFKLDNKGLPEEITIYSK